MMVNNLYYRDGDDTDITHRIMQMPDRPPQP